MGPSLEGCTDIVYVNNKVIVGNGKKSVCKARATFNGVAIKKMGKRGKLRLRNFFSITYAFQNDFLPRPQTPIYFDPKNFGGKNQRGLLQGWIFLHKLE